METVSEKVSEINGNVTTAKGFHAGGVHCGIKRKRADLAWLYSDVPAVTSGVYTTNQFQAAPLAITKESIAKEGKIKGLLVNSGIANAVTGEAGQINALHMRHLFAEKLETDDHLIAVNSTGVIGVQLPMDKIKSGIDAINLNDENAVQFSKAILTTDTFSKNACVQMEIGGHVITIGGTAKGSGMIKPNMATMLSFITTDAAIERTALDTALKDAVNKTFNCITVDGDTSTNDTVMIMANGEAKNNLITLQSADYALFLKGLTAICEMLAKQIARDGEGATKLIEVTVTGANTLKDAQSVSKSIVGSSLVKTAVYGADANWGRIICAIGYSSASFLPENVDVAIGTTYVVKSGVPNDYEETVVHDYLLNNEEITITANLHNGNEAARAWGCDLTYDYVKINASYRT